MDDKKKKVIEERIEKDSFWIKVLVITIVIVWASLVTGSWAGHYFVETQIIGKQAALSDGKNLPAEKPKNWKAVVSLDRQGNVTDSDKETEEGTELSVPDFRNIDDPIPGIDDQAIRTLGKDPQLKTDESAKPPVLPGNLTDDKEKKDPAANADTAVPTDKQSSDSSQGSSSQDAATPTPVPSKTPSDIARPVQPTMDIAKPAEPTKTSTKPAEPTKTSTKPDGPTPESSRVKESSPQAGRKDPAKKEEAPKDKSQEASSYDIQMGSFANPENADKMMTDLKQKGYKARVEKIKEGDREFYKVKMDKLDSNESAQDKAGKLKQDGFDAIIISH
ncbi:MAG: SPOR domain-containing protein [Vulcanimicrobiota bacterium]